MVEFWVKHREAETPLAKWYRTAKERSWTNSAEVQQTFNSVDHPIINGKKVTIFNVDGNKYRIVTTIHYNTQTIYIRSVLTHDEYDQEKWKEKIMTTSHLLKIKTLPQEYMKLMQLHAIRLIHDEIEYENALIMAEKLISREDLTKDQEDYFNLLCELIEKYEDVHYPIPTDQFTPLDMLRFLLEENGMNGSDLGNLLGNRQLGSKILRGERQLSKKHIRILADRFKVSADLFL